MRSWVRGNLDTRVFGNTWECGTWEFGILGTQELGHLETWVLVNLGTWDLGYLRSWVRGNLGSLGMWYLGTWVFKELGYLGAWELGNLGKIGYTLLLILLNKRWNICVAMKTPTIFL